MKKGATEERISALEQLMAAQEEKGQKLQEELMEKVRAQEEELQRNQLELQRNKEELRKRQEEWQRSLEEFEHRILEDEEERLRTQEGGALGILSRAAKGGEYQIDGSRGRYVPGPYSEDLEEATEEEGDINPPHVRRQEQMLLEPPRQPVNFREPEEVDRRGARGHRNLNRDEQEGRMRANQHVVPENNPRKRRGESEERPPKQLRSEVRSVAASQSRTVARSVEKVEQSW